MKQLIDKWRNVRVNSGLARRALGLYYRDGNVYRVPFGPIRGARIQYRNDVNFHVMLGFWELQNFRVLARVLRSGLIPADAVVCDVGANIGVFSLWLSRRCVPRGKVYAFEAVPETVTRLRGNIEANEARNVEIIPAACADRNNPVTFYLGQHHHTNSLDAQWSGGGDPQNVRAVTVDGITLDEFFCNGSRRQAPSFIKMDIEGGGMFALKGCGKCCEQAHPIFLIESHTPAEDRAISNIAIGYDYQAYRVDTGMWVEEPKDTHPNPKGMWGTILLCPKEKADAMRAVL